MKTSTGRNSVRERSQMSVGFHMELVVSGVPRVFPVPHLRAGGPGAPGTAGGRSRHGACLFQGGVVSPRRPRGLTLFLEPRVLRNTATNIPTFFPHHFPMKPASPFHNHRPAGGRLGEPSLPKRACLFQGRVVLPRRPRGPTLLQEPRVLRNTATQACSRDGYSADVGLFDPAESYIPGPERRMTH